MRESVDAQRLAGFLSSWREARETNALAPRLSRFLGDFSEVYVRPPQAVPDFQPYRTQAPKLTGFLAKLRDPLELHRSRGGVIDPWAIAGVGRKEVVNSAILATFWSPQFCGAMARNFLDSFCRRIPDPAGLLPTSEELARPYSIRTEHCPVGEASERVDITVEGESFVLGIEVKIDAKEGHEQLQRYVSSVERWAGRTRRPCVVYLAPIKPSVPGVLKAGWSDVAAAGRSTVSQKEAARSSHRFLLENFIRHCRKFGD